MTVRITGSFVGAFPRAFPRRGRDPRVASPRRVRRARRSIRAALLGVGLLGVWAVAGCTSENDLVLTPGPWPAVWLSVSLELTDQEGRALSDAAVTLTIRTFWNDHQLAEYVGQTGEDGVFRRLNRTFPAVPEGEYPITVEIAANEPLWAAQAWERTVPFSATYPPEVHVIPIVVEVHPE